MSNSKSDTQDNLQGKAKQVQGKIRNAAGAMTGDTGQQLKGKAKEMEGKAQDARGDAKKHVG